LLAALARPVAHAQVNIDQDKTPSHIYASDCAVCHKSIRGLANGRGRTALTGYLAEHYTSSDSEAAALAAYVLSGGGGVGRPASAHDALTGPYHPDAAGMPLGRESRGSPYRQQPRERGRKQSREVRRPAMSQEKPAATSAMPASDSGAATAAVAPSAPSAPSSRPSEPPATPATVQPGDTSSGATDNIPD
jgi:mono/diheme cytochrome c family protein